MSWVGFEPFFGRFEAIFTVFLGLWKQLRVFFFLVDWEKPTLRPEAEAEGVPDSGLSAWRSL